MQRSIWLTRLYDSWVLLWLSVFVVLGTFWGFTSRVHFFLMLTGFLLLPRWRQSFRQLGSARYLLLLASLLLIASFLPSAINATDMQEFYHRLEKYYRYAFLLPVFFALYALKTRLQPWLHYSALALPLLLILFWLVQKEVNGVEHWFYTNHPLFKPQYHKIAAAEIIMSFGLLALTHACLQMAQKKLAWLSWSSYIVSIVCVIIIQTRGVLIGVPVALALGLLLAFYARPGFARLRTLMLGGTVIVTLLVTATAVWQQDRLVQIKRHYVDHEGYQEASVGTRFLMWQSALNAYPEHPWIGAGAGEWPTIWDEQRQRFNESSQTHETRYFGHAHSIYVDALVTGGLVGLGGMLLALFILPLLVFWRWFFSAGNEAQRYYSLSGVMLIVTYAIYGLTEGWYARAVMISTYTLLLAILAAGYWQEVRQQGDKAAA